MSTEKQMYVSELPDCKYTAWLVDDDAAIFEKRLREALRLERIELVAFQEPQKFLDAVEPSSGRPHVVISDLQFDCKPPPPRNVVGAYLPWRVNGRLKEVGWNTQTTVLTNFLDKYLSDVCRIYKTNGFAPQLICSKSFVAQADGLREYATALRLLCESKSLENIATIMSEIPSYILETGSHSSRQAHTRSSRTKLPLIYLLAFCCGKLPESEPSKPAAALFGFLGGVLFYSCVWSSIGGIVVGAVLSASIAVALTARKRRVLGSVNIERVL